jgi:penicillin-binding protein 1A
LKKRPPEKPNKETDYFLKRFDRISRNFESGQPPTQTSFERPADLERSSEAFITPPLRRRTGSRPDPIFTDGATEADKAESMSQRQRTMRSKNTSKRNNKKKRKYRFNARRLMLTFLLIIALMFASVGVWSLSILADTPRIDAANIYSFMPENSILYDANGNVMEKIFGSGDNRGLRTNADYTQMPINLVNAFVAIEDKTFWEHHGFNVIRIIGAVIDSLKSGRNVSGTSTITQQLARNIYLEDDRSTRTMKRKVQEAYYAMQLEHQLSKEQIIEAYLNTISLGNGSYGVQAAAFSYFGKNMNELTIGECAVLAALPKAPGELAPIIRTDNENIQEPDKYDFIYRNDQYSLWYNNKYVDRQKLVLKFMLEQEMISQEQYEAALKEDIRAALKPDISQTSDVSSYFADYTIRRVVTDLMKKLNIKEEDAWRKLYSGGLRIHGTLDIKMQRAAEKEFQKNSNFPKVVSVSKDPNGNAKDKRGKILLYKYSNMFADNGNFTVQPQEFTKNDNGSVTLLQGKRLNFYKTEVGGNIDYSVELKPMYVIENGLFYNIGGAFLTIPAKYKSRDNDGNLILNAEFFKDYPKHQPGEYGIVFPPDSYQLKAKVIQPQTSLVVLDYHTGAIKVMVGGRNIEGKRLYNRANNPRQPGSSIKPMAVYAPALQRSADMVTNNNVGKYTMWTAVSGIKDEALKAGGKTWPKNWYSGYRGWMTLRKSVEQSVNVNAVKVWRDIDADCSVSFLKKLGVTTVVEQGKSNDLNPALALGGMTKGISPLEMAAGYGTFANQGVYVEPIPYTKVTNKKGEIILDGVSPKKQVMDRGVAYIMTDILRTTVTAGIAKSAAIGSQPVAGKTGTTTDNYDAWFVGLTPYYAAALWIGNDINLELSQGSVAAARLWSKVMRQLHSGLKTGRFAARPDNVVSSTVDGYSDFFIKGTVPKTSGIPVVKYNVCAESGMLATPNCPEVVSKSFEEKPTELCNIHTAPPGDPTLPNDPTDPTLPVDPATPPIEPASPAPPAEPAHPGNGNNRPGGQP